MTCAGRIEIIPLADIGEVREGAPLAAALADALDAADLVPRPDDILVVTSKIVSKAEGRRVDLSAIEPGDEARRLAALTHKDARLVEVALGEAVGVVRAAPHVLILRHRLGLVMANAGIDQSNLGPGGTDRALLLPLDPDASAVALRLALAERYVSAPAIVISDSFGRPWRHGVVNVAIGVSGLPSLVDHRGEADRDGRVLEMTQVALGDVLATAAGLVGGEGAEGIPAALIRGYRAPAGNLPATALVRPVEQDLFR